MNQQISHFISDHSACRITIAEMFYKLRDVLGQQNSCGGLIQISTPTLRTSSVKIFAARV